MAEQQPFPSPRSSRPPQRPRSVRTNELTWTKSSSGHHIDAPVTPTRGRNASPAAGQRALSASPAGRKSPYWSRTPSMSPARRFGGGGGESPSFERSPARTATTAYPFDDRASNRGVQSSLARDEQQTRRRTFKRQSIITDHSPPPAQGQYADDRHDHEERDDSRWESRQEEEEGDTPKSRNCTPNTNPRSGNKGKYSPYPPRPNSARGNGIGRLPEVTEEQGSVAADDDNRTVFTEQQEARKVRLELEEMLYSQNQKDDTSGCVDGPVEKSQHAPAERRSSSTSENNFHPQLNHQNEHEYNHHQAYRSDDDDHSVISKKSHHSRYHQQADDDDDDQSICSRRSISSNKIDGDVDRFRKRFIVEDGAQNNHHGNAGGPDDASHHSQDLQDEFETLITKMKRDNTRLKRKFHHERQKNEDVAYDLQLTKEEMRGLKHEIRAMDAERDDLEDRMASAETKLKKCVKQKNDLEADLTGKIDDLEGKLQKSEASAKSQKEALEVASRASQDKVASREMAQAKLAEELDQENERLKHEMQDLEEHLHEAEIQAARVPALEALLEQQADQANNYANDDTTIGTQHLVERKLDIAGSQIAALEKSLTIKERTVQALEQEIADLKHTQKGNSSAGVEKLRTEIVNLKRKLREYEAMDLQSLLRQSQSSIEDLEKEKTRIEAKYNHRIMELENQLKEKHNDLGGTKEFLLTQLESIMGQQKQTSEQSVKNMESLLSKVTQEKSDVEDALKTLQATHREVHAQNEAHRVQLKEARIAITELQRLSQQHQKDDYSSSGHSRGPSSDSLDVRGYLESKIDALGKEKVAVIAEYQQKLEHCHMKINSLERELSTSQDKIKKMTMEFSRSNNGRHSGDEKEAARLRAELDSHKRKNMHLEETIYIMKNEIRELETKESSNSSINNSFTQQDKFQIEKMKSELQDAHQKRRELERKVTDMQTLLGQAESVIAKTNAVAIKSVMDALKRKEQHGGGRGSNTRHPPPSSGYY